MGPWKGEGLSELSKFFRDRRKNESSESFAKSLSWEESSIRRQGVLPPHHCSHWTIFLGRLSSCSWLGMERAACSARRGPVTSWARSSAEVSRWIWGAWSRQGWAGSGSGVRGRGRCCEGTSWAEVLGLNPRRTRDAGRRHRWGT